MRLTVGPLPAAVYWRRRAVVLVGLAMVVLVVSYACNAPDISTAAQEPSPTTPAVDGSQPSPTGTVRRPIVKSPTPTTEPAFTLPVGGATGPCTDAEMRVTAGVGAGEISHGQSVSVALSIRIKNISDRKCSRDIGADKQELRILDKDDNIVWSSDDCDANKGKDVRSFTAGREISFGRTWTGDRTRSGSGAVDCDASSVSRGAVYRLVARLDQMLSNPVEIRIEA